ncbi:MAG: peptidase T [Desulfobacteraceae bacterium]|nr:MAG: peptidase T [Desulfobacteraceae bacterium]
MTEQQTDRQYPLMKEELIQRFTRYVRIDTQSDPGSTTSPSSQKQFNLAKMLVAELEQIGMESVTLTDTCYVYAALKSNIPEGHPAHGKTPKIGFIAHMDTAPNVSGKNVSPVIIESYDGQDIPQAGEEVIRVEKSPGLQHCVGHTLVTSDGTTLLGADDKGGVAAIMTAMAHINANPDQLHGDIRVAFTPDEEVGRGTANFELDRFDADFAFTLDGGEEGEIYQETFSADHAVITVFGRDTHPGTAKDFMVNATRIAAHIIARLPRDMAPETTWKKEPFIHPYHVSSEVDKAVIKILFRAFDDQALTEQQALVNQIISDMRDLFPEAGITIDVTQTYRNMKDTIARFPHITQTLEEAVRRAGCTPAWKAIRGGTDGSGLSAKGLPCPNIFIGGNNYHSLNEWISIDSLEKSVQTILNILDIYVEHPV